MSGERQVLELRAMRGVKLPSGFLRANRLIFVPGFSGSRANDEEWARHIEWHRRLYSAGYIALAWPKEWGGAGAGLVEQIV
jgi:alkylation response protein AidB-like acyl-CoA dehydrogenase